MGVADGLEMKVSIIIPAYNEAAGIKELLEQLSEQLPRSGLREFEVLVVDDGSTDETAAIARGFADVQLISHPRNQGYGAAIKSGIRRAQYDLLCITDADGTYPIGRIGDLVERLVAGRMDMVVGARTGANVRVPLLRRPAKWVIGKIANRIAGMRIPDLNSGLRVFRKKMVRPFLNLLPDSFSFTATITIAALSNGYLVDFLPIDYRHRLGRSKFKPFRDTITLVQLIFRTALYFEPLRIFIPMSLALFLLAIGWGSFSAFYLRRLADVSTLILAVAAVQVAMMGLLAELINRRLPNSFRPDGS